MPILESPTQPTHLVEVDADGNLNVNMPTNPEVAGCVRILDADGQPVTTTENGYLRVSQANVILYDQVDGSSVNTNIWNPTVSGMTVVQANGFIGLNAGSAVTTGSYAILPSIKFIPLYGDLPLVARFNVKTVNLPLTNATVELGIGTVSANTTPTDGAFFRWGQSGQFFAVINNGGAESSSAALTGSASDASGETVTLPPSNSVIHLYEIEIVEDKVRFFVDDILVATLDTPSGQAYPFNSGRQQAIARVYNGGSAPSVAPQLFIGQVIISQEDLNKQKPWQHVLASLGRSAYQSPASAFGQTANHTNSTSPVSATLSNTAAGYTTLGGRFQFAAVGAAGTDYALFAFQVPVGFQLYVQSISISCAVTGIAVATTTLFDWGIGVNASAVSLATADGTNTWAPRRIPIGLQSFAALAGIGTIANELERDFETPLVVDSGRYLHVILQIPNGAATATLVFRGDVMVSGYFE